MPVFWKCNHANAKICQPVRLHMKIKKYSILHMKVKQYSLFVDTKFGLRIKNTIANGQILRKY